MIMIGHRTPPICDDCGGFVDVSYVDELDANLCQPCELQRIANGDAPSVDDAEEITEADYLLALVETFAALAPVIDTLGHDLAEIPVEAIEDPEAIELLASLKRNAAFWSSTADALIEAITHANAIIERLNQSPKPKMDDNQ
jgi:hypothetical protein